MILGSISSSALGISIPELLAYMQQCTGMALLNEKEQGAFL